MATPVTVPTERKVENLRAFMVNLARSNRLLLPETELFKQKFIELCSSPTPNHPTYSAMIFTAIKELEEDGGSSKEAISEFIKSNYKGLPCAHTSLLIHHLAKLVEKEEIVRDYNNYYLLPKDNTSASSDDEKNQDKDEFHCGDRRNQCLIEWKDQLQVYQDLNSEAVTRQNGEENDRILQYVEHGGNLSEEQDLMTGAKKCPEREANGATLQAENLQAATRDQTLEEQNLTTEAQGFPEIEERTANLQSEQLLDQDMQNCESPKAEKQKQILGDLQFHEEDMQLEHLGGYHGDSRNLVQGPKDQTQEESVMINREDKENPILQGEVERFDEVRQTENKEDKINLEHGKVESPRIDWVVEEHVILEDGKTEGRIEVNKEEDKSQKKQDQEDETLRMNEVKGPDEQEGEMREEVIHGEETQVGESAYLLKFEFPRLVDMGKEACAEVILERDEMGAEAQLICEEEQSLEKPELKDRMHEVVADVAGEKEDKAEQEIKSGDELETLEAGGKNQLKDQQSNASRAQVQTLQEIPYELMCELEAQSTKVSEAHRRLWEQQTEACDDIVALEKMLKLCTKNQKQNETVSAMGSSSVVQNNVAPSISLPLSKESCLKLWKLVYKIQGQLFEIISSFDDTKVPYESSGCEAESIRKGSAEEGYKIAKSSCKRTESKAFCPSKELEHKKSDLGSQQKPLIERTSHKRPPDVETTTMGELFVKHKQAYFCDLRPTSILVRNDGPFDSPISKRAEAGRESTNPITGVGIRGEVKACDETTWLEKPNLDAAAVLALPVTEPDMIRKLKPKAKMPDQVALQIEATNKTLTEPPTTSPSKHRVDDGHNRIELKSALVQPKGMANLDASMIDTGLSDYLNSNKKRLHKRGRKMDNNIIPGMSSDVRIVESELRPSGQLISQAIDQNERMEVDDHDLSLRGLIIDKPDASPSLQPYKRRGRPAKVRGNADASEKTKILNADKNSHQKQEPLRVQRLDPEPGAPSTTEPRMQISTRFDLAHARTPVRITRARAAAAAAAFDASNTSFSQ